MEKAPGIEPKRLVAIFYIGAALVLGIFLEQVLEIAFSYVRWNDRQVVGDFTVSDVAGLGCFAASAAAAWLTWKNPRARAVSLEVAGELKKVTWPSLRETRAATAAVVLATFVAALVLGLFDFVWARISSLVY